MSYNKHDEPPAYHNPPYNNNPNNGSAAGYYQQQQPMGYGQGQYPQGGNAGYGPPQPGPGGYYQQGPYGPPHGYGGQPMYHAPQERQKQGPVRFLPLIFLSQTPGFWRSKRWIKDEILMSTTYRVCLRRVSPGWHAAAVSICCAR